MRYSLYAAFLCMSAVALGAAGCDDLRASSDETQQNQQEHILRQATDSVGMPAITNFFERKLMKDVYELRDQGGATITYITDLNGHLHKFCDSYGYGLPYATQFTNPSKLENPPNLPGIYIMPQADPNGLFSPASADGTWVACLNPTNHKVAVVYVEPHVVVSPFPLDVK